MDRTVTNNKLICYLAHLLLLLALVASATAHSAERITYYHNDNLGSPVAATDTQGNIIWRESYQPDGTRNLHQGDSQNKLWFTGKQEEATFGVSYFGARWYDSETGRFLAMDPVGVSANNPNSFNRYAYANNNPYRFVDPDGRESLVEAQTNLAQGNVRNRGVDGKLAWVTVCPGFIDYADPGIYWNLFTALAMPFGELSAARGVSGTGEAALIPKTGAQRAAMYGENWQTASLHDAISEFAGSNPLIFITENGKKIYANPDIGVQVVHDLNGDYFRIFDPSKKGKRAYLDLDGNIPNNKILENGKQIGRTQAEYNQATHFNVK